MADDLLIFLCCIIIAVCSYTLGWIQCRQSMEEESENVAWPAPYIYASKEEAEELVVRWRLNEVRNEVNDVKPGANPSFVLRCIEKLENNSNP